MVAHHARHDVDVAATEFLEGIEPRALEPYDELPGVRLVFGTGIRYSPREMHVTEYQPDTGKLVVRLEGAWLDAFKKFRGRDIDVVSRVMRDHALAFCFIPMTLFDE